MKLSSEDVGRRYSNALYDYAIEKDEVLTIKDELEVLKQVINDNPQLLTVLNDPLLNLSQRKQILDEIKVKFSKTMQDFLQLVFDYQRFNDFPEIIQAYFNRYNDENKIGSGKVTTAVKMSDSQLTKLNQSLAQKMGLKEMSLENAVDQDILGGAVIVAKGKKIDGSIKTKINELKRVLAQNM